MQNHQYRDPTRFTEFSTVDTTTIHPLAVMGLVVVLWFVLFGKRRSAVLWATALLCFVPDGQRIVIMGIDFAFLRILALGLGIRVFMRKEIAPLRILPMDFVVLLFALWPLMAGISRGTDIPLVRLLGYGADLLLIYLAGRALIRNADDVRHLARGLVFISIPVLFAFTIEKVTGRNFFSIFGGVSSITAVREGKVRVQGAFSHPILAGVWWSAVLPLILVLIWDPRKTNDRMLGWFGVVSCILLVIMSASSTPLVGLGVALMGALVFPYRRYLRPAWIAAVLCAFAIHMVHDLGVHHAVFAKFPGITGSTGYHRYRLIDACMNRVNEWFLVGADTSYHWGWGLDDVTCEYVRACLAGGILQFMALAAIFLMSFWKVGSLMSRAPKSLVIASYALALGVFVHMVCFIAVSYFGQILFLFWINLGALQSVLDSRSRRMVTNEETIVTRPRRPVEDSLRGVEMGRT